MLNGGQPDICLPSFRVQAELTLRPSELFLKERRERKSKNDFKKKGLSSEGMPPQKLDEKQNESIAKIKTEIRQIIEKKTGITQLSSRFQIVGASLRKRTHQNEERKRNPLT